MDAAFRELTEEALERRGDVWRCDLEGDSADDGGLAEAHES